MVKGHRQALENSHQQMTAIDTTEKLVRRFPGARICRFLTDTLRAKGSKVHTGEASRFGESSTFSIFSPEFKFKKRQEDFVLLTAKVTWRISTPLYDDS